MVFRNWPTAKPHPLSDRLPAFAVSKRQSPVEVMLDAPAEAAVQYPQCCPPHRSAAFWLGLKTMVGVRR